MKKLLFVLPVLLLAVTMLHADQVATVTNYSGSILVVHNGVHFWVDAGNPLYAGDTVCVHSTQQIDGISLHDILPIGGTRTITRPEVPQEGIWWHASDNSITNPGKGDTGTVIIVKPQPDSYFTPYNSMK